MMRYLESLIPARLPARRAKAVERISRLVRNVRKRLDAGGPRAQGPRRAALYDRRYSEMGPLLASGIAWRLRR